MKPWYESKLIWVGVGSAIAGIQGLVGANILGPAATEWALTIVGVLTILLRSMTTEPVTLRKPGDQ